MGVAGGDGLDAAGEAGYVDWRQFVVVVEAVTHLAGRVPPPAFDAAVCGECAGVAAAGGDGLDAAGEAGYVDWCQFVVVVEAVTHLAVESPAPSI